jgi:acyl-CoA reductase-like NAD-dependent aldehyde dehydrogenase
MTSRQVTPEEEMADLKAFLDDIKQFPNDDTFRYETDRGGVLAILAAIRAAENDALERAALKCEAAKPWGNMSDDHAANKLQRVADAIRALKHKEAT